MRVLRWGAVVSWLIIASLAVGGFAAFSPKPVTNTSSTTIVAEVTDDRGTTTGRILARAFANAAARRLYSDNGREKQVSAESEPVAAERAVELPASSTDAPRAPIADTVDGAVIAWESGTECRASWYGPGFDSKTTANGETFDQRAFTAAMHDIPFNTTVKVTRVDTGAVTTVRINDRGPYVYDTGWKRHPTRCIDLSEAAMEALGGIEDGVITVTISY